jgi:hypothetical protein
MMEAQIVDFTFSNFRTLASNVNILSLWNAVSRQSVQKKEKHSPIYFWIVFYLSETEKKTQHYRNEGTFKSLRSQQWSYDPSDAGSNRLDSDASIEGWLTSVYD